MKRRSSTPPRWIQCAIFTALILVGSTSHAVDLDVIITVDNAYVFGFGSKTEIKTLFGGVANCEAGDIYNSTVNGNPDNGPEAYKIPSPAAEDYLYIVAWSDNRDRQGALAQFKVGTNPPIYTGVGDWEVFATGIDKDPSCSNPNAPPLNGTTDSINSQIAIANSSAGDPSTSSVGWVGPQPSSRGALVFGEANDSSGTLQRIAPIDENARWMWYNRDPANIIDAFRDSGNHKEYLIFRLPLRQVPGVESCLTATTQNLICATDPLKGFFYTFKVKNLTDGPVRHLFLLDLPAGVTATPNAIDFSDEPGGALPPGATSKARTVRIRGAGASPGGTITFRFSMHDADLVECCALEQTIQLPTCECAQILKGNVSCGLTLGGAPTFTYNFTLESLSPSPPPVEYVLVAPKPPAKLTIGQSTQAISPALGFGGDVVRHITISGPDAVFGGKACLRISTHDQSLNECCSIDKCIALPANLFSCLEIGPNVYTPVGNVNIFTSDLGLVVDGIGTSGEDGIKFDFGRTDSFRVGWRPFEPTPPDGAFVRFGATGSVEGTPGRPLGELKITDVGSALEISADYSDVGSTTQRLEIYRDGELVQTITGHRGPVARVPSWPTSCGKSLVVLDGHSTACYWPGWDDVIPIEILGGPTVLGDGLRVLAENPAGDLDFLQTFSLRAANIPSVTVTSVQSSTPAAGDLDLTLNTGFDQATGTALPLGTLPAGTDDDDWQVVDGTAKKPTKVVINPRPAWPAALADSRWISVNPNQGRSSAARTVLLENCFCLGAGATTAELSLRLRADDEAAVFLNGTRIGGPGGGFRGVPLAVALKGPVGVGGPFVAGQNCLRVEVDDRGGIVTGLDLTGTVKAAGGACGSPGN